MNTATAPYYQAVYALGGWNEEYGEPVSGAVALTGRCGTYQEAAGGWREGMVRMRDHLPSGDVVVLNERGERVTGAGVIPLPELPPPEPGEDPFYELVRDLAVAAGCAQMSDRHRVSQLKPLLERAIALVTESGGCTTDALLANAALRRGRGA